jgi:hypothetical protein
VRSPSLDRDLDPQVALMREADVERRGLGDNRAVCPDPAEEVGGAKAAVLLVGDGGNSRSPSRRVPDSTSALAAASDAAMLPFIS